MGGKTTTENAVIRLSMGDHHENVTLGVIDLDDKPIFLGIDWLKCHNPIINWTEGFVQFDRCPRTCGYKRKDHAQLARKMDVKLEPGNKLFSMDVDTYWKERDEQRQRLRAVKTKPQQILEYPERYIAQYPDVFSEEEFDQLPPRHPWDHAIELTPDF